MARPLSGSAGATTGPDRGPQWRKEDTAPIPVVTGGPAGSPARSAEGRHAKPPRDWGAWGRVLVALREIGIVVGLALIVTLLIRLFLVQAFYVPSSSMEDTLMPGDRIAVAKLSTMISGVSRGEVVVFTDPGSWTTANPDAGGLGAGIQRVLAFLGVWPDPDGASLVKRVIGVGGDKVACCDDGGHILLNGVPLKEPYLKPGVGTDQVPFAVTVPDGGLFVMGDNRADSRDSRYHLETDSGAVPVANVIGRAVAVVWPLDRLTWLPVPKAFAQEGISPAPSASP